MNTEGKGIRYHHANFRKILAHITNHILQNQSKSHIAPDTPQAMRLPFANMLYGDIHIRNPFYIGLIEKDKA